MSIKKKSLEVLIIDDEASYVATLQDGFRSHCILLKHVTNLNAAKEFMKNKEGRSIVTVILDVNCLKDEKQEVADPSFITAAVKYFDQTYPQLPKLILTGATRLKKNLEEIFDGTQAVFSKAVDEENVANYIIEKSKNLEYIQLSKEHPLVCELFDEDILGDDSWKRFLYVYNHQKSNDSGLIENCLTNLRKIQEDTYKAINKVNSKIVATTHISGDVKCRAINNDFVNNGVLVEKDILNSFIWDIYTISSNFGSHTLNFTPCTTPTKYTVMALFNALCDLLLWCRKIVLKV